MTRLTPAYKLELAPGVSEFEAAWIVGVSAGGKPKGLALSSVHLRITALG